MAALTPKETAQFPNYPNPFNPETWIPYQLAKAADVTVTIYAVDGTVVRTLALGHQPIGIYQGKSRAAYWDGRNNVGEPVASGIYFYTLTAGDFFRHAKNVDNEVRILRNNDNPSCYSQILGFCWGVSAYFNEVFNPFPYRRGVIYL